MVPVKQHLQAFRRVLAELTESAARFVHLGVVVSYRGLVIDQVAIVGAIDAAVAALPPGLLTDPTPLLRLIRVRIERDDAGGDTAAMMASWSTGLRERGLVRVVGGPGCANAIRDGVTALLRSAIDKDWRPAPMTNVVH